MIQILQLMYCYFQPICCQCTLSLPPENIKKLYGFMMFPEGRERVHWEQMGSRAQVPDNASADPIIISGEQGK